MKTFLLAFLTTLLTVTTFAADAPAPVPPVPDDDAKNLQGTWVIESATAEGKAGKDIGGELVIAGDKFTLRDKSGAEHKNTFKIDATKTPKTFILTPEKGESGAALAHFAFELSGDTLKLAMTGLEKWPTEISDKGQVLFTLKRKKP